MEMALGTEWSTGMAWAVVVVRAVELESSVRIEWAAGMETVSAPAVEMVRSTAIMWDFFEGLTHRANRAP